MSPAAAETRAPGAARAVLFDLDGVLIDSLPVYRRAWAHWARRYGIDEARIWQDAHGKRPSDIITRVTPELDLAVSLGDFKAAMATSITLGAHAVAGVAGILGDLPPGSWAIVTSGYRSHVVLLLEVAGLPAPPVLVCGEDVASGKPNPECFELAARLLGVPARDCLVVEDAPVGIEAAHRAGMEVLAVLTTHEEADLVAADKRSVDLNEARPVIVGWLSDRS